MSLKYLIGLSVLVCGSLSTRGEAQDLRELLNDKQMRAYDAVLQRWNNKELDLPAKAELTDAFVKRLDERVERKPGGYETQGWQRFLRANWDKLPARAAPELALTPGARLVLLGGVADNLEQIQKNRLEPDPDAIIESDRVSLFVVLAGAQQEAQQIEAVAISSNFIERVLTRFRTGVFPFCKIEVPR